MNESEQSATTPGYQAGLNLHPRSPQRYAEIPRLLEQATAFAAEVEAVFVQISLADGSTITVARDLEDGQTNTFG